jgi:hypothetical protein
MCYSENISITTYIVGLIGCGILIKYNYYVEAVIYFWVIQMQLVEYFIWRNQNCNIVNKNVTKIGLLVNNLEPVVLWLGIYLFSKKILPDWVNYVMIVFVVISLIYSYQVYGDYCTNVTEESKPYLYWKWNTGKYFEYYYAFFLIVINILCIYGVENGYKAAIIINTLFFTSRMIYSKYNSVGNLWCFATAFAPFITLLIYNIDFKSFDIDLQQIYILIIVLLILQDRFPNLFKIL